MQNAEIQLLSVVWIICARMMVDFEGEAYKVGEKLNSVM
jgi:hypothetical protein